MTVKSAKSYGHVVILCVSSFQIWIMDIDNNPSTFTHLLRTIVGELVPRIARIVHDLAIFLRLEITLNIFGFPL